MQISKRFGLAVYVSVFKSQKPLLEKLKGTETPVFTSLHLTEEVTESYVRDVEEMCEWLHRNGFWIMADVSPLTLERFKEDSLASLSKRLHLNNLRLDFGFDLDKLKREELVVSFTYNASILLEQDVEQENCLYMHNFYPRPETGLDRTFFSSLNEQIREKSGQILAFISGDEKKRGPLFEGLPTLEEHRYLSPYAQFVDLLKRHNVDKVFLGDVKLSDFELNLILNYLEDDLIRLPVNLPEELAYLYNKAFTVRVDSPQTLIRVQESRQYAQAGKSVDPVQMIKRFKGSVTMDNIFYKRYSGEVQITKKDYPKDERINVIGQLDEKYHLLIDNLNNGEKFVFIPTQ